MSMITIGPEVEADAVLYRFGRRRLQTALAREKLYLPYFLFGYRVEWTTLGGKPKAMDGLLCADLLQGLPMAIPKATRFALGPGLEEELVEFASLLDHPRPKRTVLLSRTDVPEEKLLPAVLSSAEAVERGKSVLRYDLMRLIGGLRFRTISLSAQPGGKVLYYPFWLIYYKDRRERMRFDAFDALTGQRERGETLRSIKLGLLQKSGKI
jgi:hypothetical protein